MWLRIRFRCYKTILLNTVMFFRSLPSFRWYKQNGSTGTGNTRAPFSTNRKQHRTSSKIHQKYPKTTPELLQNGTKSRPKTIQGALRTDKRKLIMNSLIFGRPGSPKWSPQITPKWNKMDLDPLLLALKKTWFPRSLFLRFFYILEASQPWKSSQNAILYAKNAGRHFLIKNCIFPKNWQKKPSRTTQKQDKTQKTPPGDPLETHAKNVTKKMICVTPLRL